MNLTSQTNFLKQNGTELNVDEDTPEDEIPTYEDIEAKFQEHMDALIDGLELYADITEDEDEEDPTEEATEDEED